jgi:hypothetical protein
MRPTRLPILIALFVVAGAVAYPLTSSHYANSSSPTVYGPVSLLLLAAAEGYTAYTTRARLAGRPRTRPIEPITVARIAALAKASSPVAALAAGAYTGFLAYVAQIQGPQVSRDIRTGIAGLVCGLVLAGAALALERVCRVKPPPPVVTDRER